jgi:hypothetical protein
MVKQPVLYLQRGVREDEAGWIRQTADLSGDRCATGHVLQFQDVSGAPSGVHQVELTVWNLRSSPYRLARGFCAEGNGIFTSSMRFVLSRETPTIKNSRGSLPEFSNELISLS